VASKAGSRVTRRFLCGAGDQANRGIQRGIDPTAVPWREAGVDVVLECQWPIQRLQRAGAYFSQLGLQTGDRLPVRCGGLIAGERKALKRGVRRSNHRLTTPSRHPP